MKDLERIRRINRLLQVPPSTDLVEIINITKLDGSKLEPENWRREWIGKITACHFSGGLKKDSQSLIIGL